MRLTVTESPDPFTGEVRGTVQDQSGGVMDLVSSVRRDEEDRQRVFERFYRVDRSRSRQMGGTGLGLSLVKWPAEAHEGHIEVDTEAGRGSTFRLTLPASTAVD